MQRSDRAGARPYRGAARRAPTITKKADARRGVSNFVIRYVVPFQVALGRINRFVNGG